MATIKLRDICLNFNVQPEPFEARKKDQRMPEDNVGVAVGVRALDHLNLTVPDGQTYVILGPSGCGKSSLLRVVAGVEQGYTGEVLFDGEPVENIPPGERYIGMVFQNYALYPNFKGEGNLRFFFQMHRISDKETEERIKYTSELMGIGFRELLPRKPGTLSGGEKQRVAIARAIVRQPRLMLFDEPLSNLDAKLRVRTRGEIKKLLHQFQVTALYVTHDQVEAVALADQIVVMRQGKVEQLGSFQTLTESPATTFVAGFVGFPPMNLFKANPFINGRVKVVDSTATVPPHMSSLLTEGQQVIIGVRPEAVTVRGSDATGHGVRSRLTGQVLAVEPNFAQRNQLISIQSNGETFAAISPLDMTFRVGENISAFLSSEDLHLFDAATGRRLV